MDTSKEYVEMCREAEEIQERKHFIGGSFFVHFVTGKWQKPCVYTYGMMLPYESGDYSVWLPRQDQLQEMIGNFPDVLKKLYDEIWTGDHGMYLGDWGAKCTSMEQLWLAFVMKEKFNKTWNGEKWA
jgi:hypothetical protein